MNEEGIIAIVTLNGNCNYGNRFQNYALQQVLLNYSNHVETLLIRKDSQCISTARANFTSLLSKAKQYPLLMVIKKSWSIFWYSYIGRQTQKKQNSLREKSFVTFSQTNIKEVDLGISAQSIPSNLLAKYDFFIVGSDQVWNPTFPEFSELFFLTFAPKHKRIAYAPSFGLNELPEELKDDFAAWIADIKYLSVREESGANIIRNLIGRDVPVMLDPTMLLKKEDWKKVSTPVIDLPKGPYILTYFLGTLDTKRNKEIKLFAKKHDMKLVQVNDKNSKYYSTGPSEFISLIDKASLILTDSFHGTVFSILFEKPFLTYKRIGGDNMYSRIETLFSLLHLQDRQDISLFNPNLWEIDYTEVNKLLQIERNKALDYLSACFSPTK
jgi:hypothetical protein